MPMQDGGMEIIMEYLVVTDFIDNTNGRDVADDLQQLIDKNPNRTLFFPDGDYYLSKPIVTPAYPKLSVSLKLSNYARIAAADNWNGDGALVRLGGKDFANDIRTVGSNYYFEGGIIDGSGVADGISIDGGRETAVRNVSIKHTRIGLYIKRGANGGSSDADIFGVNIVGNRQQDSIGLLTEGWDNTFTNMRISDVFIGVWLKSSGNMLRNVHPLYTLDYEDFENSCGFISDEGKPDNWFDFCYSDQFAIGFLIKDHVVLQNCFCFWYSPREKQHIAVKAVGEFKSIISNLVVGFCGNEAENAVLKAEKGGRGIIQNLIISSGAEIHDEMYKEYLTGTTI